MDSEPIRVTSTRESDSQYRCPYDGKRLVIRDFPTKGIGEDSTVHECPHCPYQVVT